MKSKKAIFLFGTILVLAAIFFFVWNFVLSAFRGELAVRADYFIGPVSVHMYSLIIFAAFLTGYFLAVGRAPLYGLSRSVAEDLVVLNAVFGFLGARIFHVLSQWRYYSARPLEIFFVWHGGLAIYGAIFFGVLASVFYCVRKKIDFFRLSDLLAPALALGLALGRWGNFFNQEAYGTPTTLPWKMFVAPERRLGNYFQSSFFHPVFLYESLWDFAVFGFLMILGRKRRADGVIFGWFLVLYSSARFFLEPLRADSIFFGAFRINQVLSFGAFLAGLALLLYGVKRSRRALPKTA